MFWLFFLFFFPQFGVPTLFPAKKKDYTTNMSHSGCQGAVFFRAGRSASQWRAACFHVIVLLKARTGGEILRQYSQAPSLCTSGGNINAEAESQGNLVIYGTPGFPPPPAILSFSIKIYIYIYIYLAPVWDFFSPIKQHLDLFYSGCISGTLNYTVAAPPLWRYRCIFYLSVLFFHHIT